ncbi:MAG TPA: ATP-grasp domain-containing protein [Flavitalea sp.]|nr:ATP-grasp domain-containing protein [Flavitalea sp.]
MPPPKPRVLIATTVEWESLSEIPYIFNKGGCVVDILCPPNAWVLKNSHVHHWINSKNSDDFLSLLLQTIESDHYDWIVPLDDILLKMIRENPLPEGVKAHVIPLCKHENIEILGSKSGLEKICEKYGFNRPKTAYSDDITSLADIKEQFAFPVLLKLDHSWGGIGIVLSKDFDHLQSVIESMPPTGYLVQEYISGKDIGVESLFRCGQLLTIQSGHVIEYTGTQFEPTIRREYFYDQELTRVVQQIGADIGINGFASMQFIYDKSKQQYYLLEVDVRPQAWCRYGDFTGNDFSEGVKRFTGQVNNVPTNLVKENGKPVEVVLFHKSLIAIIRKRSPWRLLKFIFNTRNWKYIPFYDRKYLKYVMIDVKDRILDGIRKKYTARN